MPLFLIEVLSKFHCENCADFGDNFLDCSLTVLIRDFGFGDYKSVHN